MRVLLLPLGAKKSRLELAMALERDAAVSEVEISNDPGQARRADVVLIAGCGERPLGPDRAAGCTYIVVAEDPLPQRIQLLEGGADVVLHGEVSIAEIVAQVRAVARRRAPAAQPNVRCPAREPQIMLGADRRHAIVLGRRVSLTLLEGHLLAAFIARPGELLCTEDLMTSVWGSPFGARSTVSAYIRRLRVKIEPDPSNPVFIQTVWGGGYVYRPEDTP